jgi:predicted membrane protein
MELKIDMGAGQGNLHLRDVPLTRLDLNIGAGQVDVDLTGDRKVDLTADIEGGVGQANIRLPKNVGVIVHASGGIGSIDAHGLKHEDDTYTNDAYGKTPATIRLKVEGGIGEIVLSQEL